MSNNIIDSPKELTKDVKALEEVLLGVKNALKGLGTESSGIEELSKGVKGLGGAFAAAKGSLKLFGIESKSLGEIESKIKSVTEIVGGLQLAFKTFGKTGGWLTIVIGGVIGLVDWYKKLNKEINGLSNSQQVLEEVNTAVTKSLSQNRTELYALAEVAKDETKSNEIRKKALEKLNELMPELNGYINDEGQLIGDVDRALHKYLNTLYKIAKAKALITKIADVDIKISEQISTGSDDSLNFWEQGWAVVSAPFKGEKDFQVRHELIQGKREAHKEELRQLGIEKDQYKEELNEILRDDAVTNEIIGESSKTKKTFVPETDSKKESDQKKKDERLVSEKKINDEMRSLAAKNISDHIELLDEGTQKELAQIEDHYNQTIANIRQREQEWRDAQGGELKPEQEKALTDAKELAGENRTASEDDHLTQKLEAENKAMNEFLTKYGDFYQKKLAITESFEERIAKAETDGEKQTLQKEKNASVSDLNMDDFKQNIQWENVFGDLQKQSTESLTNLVSTVRMFMQQIGNELTVKDKESLTKSIDSIEKEISGRNPFVSFINGINEFKTAREQLPDLLEELKTAQEEFALAQDDLAAQTKLVDEGKITQESESYKNALAKMQSAQRGVVTGTGNVNKNLSKQKESLKTISAATKSSGAILSSLGKDAASLAKVFNGDVGNAISNAVGLFDNVVNATSSIIDSLDDMTQSTVNRIGTVVESSATGITAASVASAAAIKTVESASVILAIISAAVQVVTALFSMFGGAKEISKATLDEYKAFMDVTDKLIKQQEELMKTVSGVQLAMTNEKGKKIIEDQIQATRELGKEYMKSGSSWKSRSVGYDLTKMLRKNGDTLKGGEFEGMHADRLFELSPDKLKTFMETYPKIWAKMDEDTRKYLETIIECDEKMKDLEESAKEAAMQMSFDEFSGELNNLLLNVDTTFEDVADSFELMMRKAIIKLVMNQDIIERLKKWYEKAAKIFQKDEKDITDEEINGLKKEWFDIHDDGQKTRDKISNKLGIDFSPTPEESDNSAERGSFQTMSQETGSELLGQFTAIRIHTSNIHELIKGLEKEDKLVNNCLTAIEKNTFNTVGELKEVNNKLKQLTVEGIKIL